MRLVRGVIRPTDIRLSRQLRWCLDIKTSNASLNPELVKRSSLEVVSDIQWRGRSFAASVQSNAAEGKKARRRVSKHERRSMVEEYVNNYRAMNAGKFPTIKDARKDVGGSFYYVRQILQEMIYNSKMSPMDRGDTTSLAKGFTKNDVISTPISSSEARSDSDYHEYGQIQSDDPLATELVKESELLIENKLIHQTADEVEKEKPTIEAKRVFSNLVREGQCSIVEAEGSSCESLEPKEEPQTSISLEEKFNDEVQQLTQVSDKSKDIGSQSHWPTDEPRSSLHSDAETSIKQETRTEDKLELDGLSSKAESQQSSESEVSGSESHEMPTEDAELQKKSTVWQNLKTFASSLFGVWKR